MAEAISSSSSVASGAQVAALAVVQSQLAQDRTPADGTAAAAMGQALAAGDPTPQAAAPAPGKGASKNASPATQAGPQALDEAVKSLLDYIKPQESVTLQVDKGSGEPFVKFVNTQTKQTILQIPSAQVLAMARKLHEMANPQTASGVLVDEEG
jgi:uncharacterized FlaG/YvyC family protein